MSDEVDTGPLNEQRTKALFAGLSQAENRVLTDALASTSGDADPVAARLLEGLRQADAGPRDPDLYAANAHESPGYTFALMWEAFAALVTGLLFLGAEADEMTGLVRQFAHLLPEALDGIEPDTPGDER